MIKFIVRNKELLNNKKFKVFFYPSFQYLDEINDNKVFTNLVDSLRLHNGSYKTTLPNRFIDLDKEVISILDKKNNYSIHDIAASDGTTTIEFYERLNLANIGNSILFSDKYSELKVYKYLAGTISIYADIDGNVLYGNVFGILADISLSWKYFISKVLGKFLPRTISLSFRQNYTVSLIGPTAKRFLGKDKVAFENRDIFSFKPKENSFDIIRCMNILNPRYFSTEMLKEAILNIWSELKPSGLLIVGRTEISSGINHATFYQKVDSKTTNVLKSFGEGSEINHLISSVINVK